MRREPHHPHTSPAHTREEPVSSGVSPTTRTSPESPDTRANADNPRVVSGSGATEGAQTRTLTRTLPHTETEVGAGPGPRTVWQWMVAGGVLIEALPAPVCPSRPTARAVRMEWRDAGGTLLRVLAADLPVVGVGRKLVVDVLAPQPTDESLGASLLICSCQAWPSVGEVLLAPAPSHTFLDLASRVGRVGGVVPPRWWL